MGLKRPQRIPKAYASGLDAHDMAPFSMIARAL